MPETSSSEFTTLTAEIVSAYLTTNKVNLSALSGLIQAVHQSLLHINAPEELSVEECTKATPAQIRKSITPEALISFEDGKPYKTLKRHLSKRGMTAAEYKSKWGLPQDYPTTSPKYSAHRSEMAKSLGLGNRNQDKKTQTTKLEIAPKPDRSVKASKAAKGAVAEAPVTE